MSNQITISGVVEDFERTTHVSGVQQRTSTTHLSIFKVDSHRVMLKTSAPSVISDGDKVILAGTQTNGQFTALACNNLSANWISPLKQQGCAFAALICVAVFSFLMFFLVIPIIFGVVCIFLACKINKSDNILREAHQLVQNV